MTRAHVKGVAAAAATLVAMLLAGCGGSTAPGRATPASLVLDFTPNAIHSGIYTAIARHYDRRAGVALHVIVPGASTDSIKLLTGGRVDFAILDIHDLAIADQHPSSQPLVGIMALVERPLAAVIAGPGVHSPKALSSPGHVVGVTGAPSDFAVLRSVVAGAGGDPKRLNTVTIGYNAVADLLSHRVAAATAFWNDEGVTLQRARPGFSIFRVDDFGAPAYPELILCTTRAELRRHPSLARGVVDALTRGYAAVIADPGAGVRALESEVTGLSPKLVEEQLAAELPAFAAPGPGSGVGALRRSTLASWAQWEARFGIVKRPPDVAAMFDSSFVPTGRGGA